MAVLLANIHLENDFFFFCELAALKEFAGKVVAHLVFCFVVAVAVFGTGHAAGRPVSCG